MAVTEYINNNGEKNFSVYVNLRSKNMPNIRFQKRIKGVRTKAEAYRKEKSLVRDLNQKISLKEGHGLSWRSIVSRWSYYANNSPFLDRPYNPATIKDYVAMMSNWTGGWLDRPASDLTRGDGREVLESAIQNQSFSKKT